MSDPIPAFPQLAQDSISTYVRQLKGGMELRDYFAAKAMHALWNNEENRTRAVEDSRINQRGLYDEIAASAYDMAAAMMEARKR